MRNTHSTFADQHFATQATVAADIARFAPPQVRPISEAAILLLTALARHDGRTYMHSLRVSRLAWQLSLLLDGDQELVQSVFLAALLHDIGKLDLPRSILQKAAPLTAAEWSMVRLYPDRGARLLQGQDEFALLIAIVASHQERPDGMGYPRGLLQPAIPCAALKIAVADATDAMGSHRPYAARMTAEEIREELWAGAGACWDYGAATLAAQELAQPSHLTCFPRITTAHASIPAVNLSAGYHASAPGFEAKS